MKIQELLDCKDKWTQEVEAINENKEAVRYYSSNAIKWCLLGAIFRCYPVEYNEIINMIKDITNTSIGTFNDSHSYEEVMELVRRLDI